MQDETAERKRWLRSEYRRRRRTMPVLDKMADSQATVEAIVRIIGQLYGEDWPHLASYMATAEEVDLGLLHGMAWDHGRPVWLPRIQGPGRLEWYPIRSADQVRIGTLNICEPDPDMVVAQPLPERVLMAVPGVAFGPDGRRLGMGGGFYDRLLGAFPGVSVGVGFANQLCEDLPSEPHDHPVDICIIAGDVIHCRPDLRQPLGLA